MWSPNQRLWTSGARYEGQWVEDKMHGNGLLQNQEGAKYEGAFRNGLRWVLFVVFFSLLE